MHTKKIKYQFLITEIMPRLSAPGVWARGRLDGHDFVALVFGDHAKNPTWEIGKSCISKLELKRVADGRVVYNWDRGLDVPPADSRAAAALECLTLHLADRVFHRKCDD